MGMQCRLSTRSSSIRALRSLRGRSSLRRNWPVQDGDTQIMVTRAQHKLRAFTLIELLVVIAIIAILAAILFPVFAVVREQARQSNTMSSLHSVYVGSKMFFDDEGHFPSTLFP